MPTYTALVQFTAQGLQNIHESTHRAEAFRRAARKAGVKVLHQLWTLGAYDGVLILEAANDGVAMGLMVSLAALGNVKVTTLPAFDATEFAAVIGKAAKQ